MIDLFTAYTWQDWEAEADKVGLIRQVIASYMGSEDFRAAIEASEYFRSDNRAIKGKTVMKAHRVESKDERGLVTSHAVTVNELSGSRIPNGFFFRFVTQQNQHLLANGVVLGDDAQKERLGAGFDKVLAKMGEKALVHGVCYGYWNNDHLEMIPAASDKASGMVVLLDELTSVPMVGIQFWRIAPTKPLTVRVFEPDGVTMLREDKDNHLVIVQDKRAYRLTIARDAGGAEIVGAENYGALPVVPLYANEEHASELTPSIKAKIDAYDHILSDFDNNLDRANEVYWALNNFGGSINQIMETMEWINKLKVVVNKTDGMGGGATAEPHTIDVPYQARAAALELLEKALYQDYMALNFNDVTGGSLTNVAIRAASAGLDLKCDRYEWQVFAFVQQILRLAGVETEEIRFNRQTIGNESEIIQNIYLMRQDIDRATALKLNPYIMQDEIDSIMQRLDGEELVGVADIDALQNEVNADGDEAGESIGAD